MALEKRQFKRQEPDINWKLNRMKRTIAAAGKKCTLRIEPEFDGKVDVLGSTQPLATIVYRDEEYWVLNVPPGVIQTFHIEKQMGKDHYIGMWLFEYEVKDE